MSCGPQSVQEGAINWQQFEGNWHVLQGKAKAR
jgi:hypothetical protein